MKIKLPFSVRMEDDYFRYLIDVHDYSVPEALRILDYLRAHFNDFTIFRNIRKINSPRVVFWVIKYRGVAIENDKLLKFIENDCLPF